MKLDELHQISALEASLLGNVAVKTMLKPIGGRHYYWKNFEKIEQQPEPMVGGGGRLHGGHYDAAIEGKPRLKKYFGGYPYGSIPI